ncbi:MAG: alpha-E domain-containing protein, partial [Candidatus Competibacteraceae bacterium]|nr:alpha-E domain-containing protein [Candidatus Competibacteraceae bacterium]
YRSQLHPLAIVDLLLFDEDNPRSVGYQIRRIMGQLDLIHRPGDTPYRSAEQRLILQASTTLALADLDALAALGREGEAGAELARLLDALDAPLAALSEALIHSHFSHAGTPRQLLEMG